MLRHYFREAYIPDFWVQLVQCDIWSLSLRRFGHYSICHFSRYPAQALRIHRRLLDEMTNNET